MENQAVLAVIIFICAYTLIISEYIHRTVVAMVGAVLVVVLGIVGQEKALQYVDFNTLGLLVGMMVLVAIVSKTGIFNYLAILMARLVKAKPTALLFALSFLTAILSAFLDNVTTVLLMTPIIFSLTKKLNVPAEPYLLSEVIASNIGGTATLIGDPPNIMIGSAVKELDFISFIDNLAVISFLALFVVVSLMMLFYRKRLLTTNERRKKLLSLDPNKEITDKKLLIKCMAVMMLTLCGFFLHQFLHVESATVALAGAFLLLLLTVKNNEELEEVFTKVEWPTLFFFIGLFVLVGGLVETGVIDSVAAWTMEQTGGDVTMTAFLILWFSALASAFVDNIPFVATMIPMIKGMGALGINNLEPLWWSLSLGACFGGNGTLVGASANLIVVGLAEREGHHISFKRFFLIGFPMMLVSLLIASAYIYFRYLSI